MIITDHLPKWLINKAEAEQIIYPYGSVNIKFRVNGLKRIRGLGCQVMDCHTRPPWKYDPFNKFAESCSLPPSSTSLCIPLTLFFMKVSFFPKVCLLTKCKPHLVISFSYGEKTSNDSTVKPMNTTTWSTHLYQVSNVWHLDHTGLCKPCESYRTLKWWDKSVRGQCKPCQDNSLWHSLHKSRKDS